MKTISGILIPISIIYLLASDIALGQNHKKHTPGMSHEQSHEKHTPVLSHEQSNNVRPVELGQSAFAALTEIVTLLEADTNTDWSQVNIDALRNHLVDMNQLTLYSTVVSRQPNQQSVEFKVTGQGRTHQAIRSMVPRHAEMVSQSTAWDILVSDISDGVLVTITSDSLDAVSKIKALGFFGFMTLGAHHQAHHLQMATGHSH